MTVLEDPASLFGDEPMQDPYPLYERMLAAGPVHRVGDSDFYAVCGWQAVVDAVARVDDFSSNLTAAMVYDGHAVTTFGMGPLDDPIHALATADDPAHAIHRKILLPHLSARRVRVIEDFAERTAQRLWSDGVCDGRIEWMGALANRLPMMVVAKLLGLPDDDVDELIRLAYGAASVLDGVVTPAHLESAGAAAIELAGYVLRHFANAATNPGQGLMGDMAARCASGELDQMPAMTIMLTLFSAAGESTASLLGSALSILCGQPDVQHRLREEQELLGRFIEEVLRYEPPFRGHYRHVRRDTVLDGTELPSDSHLLLLWGAANRDAAQFDSPEEFRLDRGAAKGHVSFGKGAHFCVGAALARLEARIVLRMLLERTSWVEAADPGQWMPSILVRRLERLELVVS